MAIVMVALGPTENSKPPLNSAFHCSPRHVAPDCRPKAAVPQHLAEFKPNTLIMADTYSKLSTYYSFT